MNLFNRVFIIALALLWLVVWLVVIYFAGFDPDRGIEQIFNLGQFLADRETALTRAGIIVLASILTLISLLFVVLEMMPEESPGLVLSRDGGGSTFVSKQSIVERVRYEAESVEGVVAAQPRAKVAGRSVDVRLRLRVTPEVVVPEKVQEVRVAVREALRSSMGIQVRRLDIPVEIAPPAVERGVSGPAARGTAQPTERVRVPQAVPPTEEGAEGGAKEEAPS